MNPLKLALILSAVDRITEPVRSASKSVAGFKKEVQETIQTAQKMADVGRSMESVGRSAMILGGAITYANMGVLKQFSDLEDAQASAKNAYSTIAGIDKGFESINKQVVDAGNKFPGTTAEFMNMAAAMKKMGMETGTIESGAFKGAAALKVMFDLNPGQAGEQFVQMGRAMGVAGKDSLAFADQLQRTSYASGLNLAEITDAMQYMSAPLKALHMANGLDDAKMILATMGVLKQAGMQGSMIGTAIAQSLEHLALIKPKLQASRGVLMGEAAAALDRAGIGRGGLKFFDAKGTSLGMGNFLAQIDRIKNIKSDADRALIGKELFGDQGARLVEQVDLKSFSTMAEKMAKQEDITKRLDRITATLGNRFKAASGTARNVAAALGEQMAPALYAVLDKANAFLTTLSGLIERHPALTKVIGLTSLALGSFLAVGGGAVWLTGKFITGVSEGIVAWQKFSSVLGKLDMLGRLAQQMRAFTLATWLNVRCLWAQVAASRAGEAIGGWIKGQIAMVKFLTTATWSAVTATWAQVTAFARLAASSIAGWFMTAVRGVVAFTSATWSSVVALYAQAAAFAVTPFGMVTIAIVALIAVGILLWKNWDKIVGFFKGAWNYLTGVFHKTPSWVLLMLPFIGVPLLIIKHWSKIKAFFGKVIGWVMGFGKSMFHGGVNIVKSIWEGIKSMAHKPVEAIMGIMKKVRRFLPFSPAKEGPLSDLHKLKFMETIADSMKPETIVAKIRQTAALASKAFRPVVSAAMAIPLAAAGAACSGNHGLMGSGGGPISIQVVQNITFPAGATPTDKNAFLAMMRDCAPETARLIDAELKRSGRTAL